MTNEFKTDQFLIAVGGQTAQYIDSLDDGDLGEGIFKRPSADLEGAKYKGQDVFLVDRSHPDFLQFKAQLLSQYSAWRNEPDKAEIPKEADMLTLLENLENPNTYTVQLPAGTEMAHWLKGIFGDDIEKGIYELSPLEEDKKHRKIVLTFNRDNLNETQRSQLETYAAQMNQDEQAILENYGPDYLNLYRFAKEQTEEPSSLQRRVPNYTVSISIPDRTFTLDEYTFEVTTRGHVSPNWEEALENLAECFAKVPKEDLERFANGVTNAEGYQVEPPITIVILPDEEFENELNPDIESYTGLYYENEEFNELRFPVEIRIGSALHEPNHGIADVRVHEEGIDRDTNDLKETTDDNPNHSIHSDSRVLACNRPGIERYRQLSEDLDTRTLEGTNKKWSEEFQKRLTEKKWYEKFKDVLDETTIGSHFCEKPSEQIASTHYYTSRAKTRDDFFDIAKARIDDPTFPLDRKQKMIDEVSSTLDNGNKEIREQAQEVLIDHIMINQSIPLEQKVDTFAHLTDLHSNLQERRLERAKFLIETFFPHPNIDEKAKVGAMAYINIGPESPHSNEDMLDLLIDISERDGIPPAVQRKALIDIANRFWKLGETATKVKAQTFLREYFERDDITLDEKIYVVRGISPGLRDKSKNGRQNAAHFFRNEFFANSAIDEKTKIKAMDYLHIKPESPHSNEDTMALLIEVSEIPGLSAAVQNEAHKQIALGFWKSDETAAVTIAQTHLEEYFRKPDVPSDEKISVAKKLVRGLNIKTREKRQRAIDFFRNDFFPNKKIPEEVKIELVDYISYQKNHPESNEIAGDLASLWADIKSNRRYPKSVREKAGVY